MHEDNLGKKVVRISANIEKKRFAFIFCLVGVFIVLFSILSAIDFVPEPKDVDANDQVVTTSLVSTTVTSATTTAVTSTTTAKKTDDAFLPVDAPVRIIASTIGLDAKVLNPTSRDTTTLDTALLSGAVRYPGSATLDTDGTMFIFGHSSNVPVVRNLNFKVFNNLKNLKEGDLIHVESKGVGNVYRVGSVTQAPADTIRVDLNGFGKRLVLSTCNSFGGKDSRTVVEATFVGSYPLSNNP